MAFIGRKGDAGERNRRCEVALALRERRNAAAAVQALSSECARIVAQPLIVGAGAPIEPTAPVVGRRYRDARKRETIALRSARATLASTLRFVQRFDESSLQPVEPSIN